MKLVDFSVTNYRSITTAHKIVLRNLTVLVGKNNEGKSNLLMALNIAMQAVMLHSKIVENSSPFSIRNNFGYSWQRDFPVQYQTRRNGLESIFKLHFRLEEQELSEFHNCTGIRGNEDIPITVKIGKDNRPRFEVPKRGSSSYNRKSKEITEFISKRITFNYIQAIRTESMAITALEEAVSNELELLNNNEEYLEAQKRVVELQNEVLERLSKQLVSPLKLFIPSINDISIKRTSRLHVPRYLEDIDIIIDDGIPTSIRYKGDGIKSLVTLAILKDRKLQSGASIIAIEEPESHLHSGAIHSLVDVVQKMASNSQVIISTHNPLFVQQNKINSNIVIEGGTARTARSISEIRSVLGVWPSDNLRNARYVLLVEGEDDKVALYKILPAMSEVIKQALQNNTLVIKALGGASNLSHDANDLKNAMCRFVALLDYDKAGLEAADKAITNGVIKESEIKYTICNGSPEAEFEDCLKPELYAETIKERYNVDICCQEFRGKEKWSERMRKVFLSQGSRWTESLEQSIKALVADSIPENMTKTKLETVLIQQKSGFIDGLALAIETLVNEDK